MMKRICAFFLALAGIWILLMPSSYVQAEDATLDDTLTDNLSDEDEVKWYSFEMAEPGDAVLVVTGLQDHWDGYAYHWQCVICEADQESVITGANISGCSETNGPSVLSVPGLAAGTYYVQMARARSSNPLMATFTTDPYQMQLFRYYPTAYSAPAANNQIQTFQNAGDILWAFDGTAFVKLHDGECYGALAKNIDGAIVPVLIGKEESAVEYVISSTGERVTATPLHYEPLGDDSWYYSESRYVDAYTDAAADTSSLPMLYLGDAAHMSTAAKEMADHLFQPEAEEPPPEDPEPAGQREDSEPIEQPEGSGSTAQPEGPESAGQTEDPESSEQPAESEPAGQPEKTKYDRAVAWMEERQDALVLVSVGIVALFTIRILLSIRRGPSRRRSRSSSSYSSSSSRSYSRSSSSSSSYSSSGYGSSFGSSRSEGTFTQGGATGCGIGGSFCGCGDGR